jgi:hypothetical protein
MITRWRVLLVGLCLALVAGTGCQPRQPSPPRVDIGDELAFETIELDRSFTRGNAQYPKQEPAAFVLWKPEDVTQIEPWISPDAADQVRATDFSQQIVITVFQGLKPTLGFDAIVERVGIRDTTLVIVVQFWQNPPNVAGGAAMTSPYHLIRTARDNRRSPQSQVEMHSYTRYHEK